jgi:hypothetical protein
LLHDGGTMTRRARRKHRQMSKLEHRCSNRALGSQRIASRLLCSLEGVSPGNKVK